MSANPFPQELVEKWKLEGNLYSYLHTLNLLSQTLERRELDPSIFHRQNTELLSQIIVVRSKLQSYGFDLQDFITINNLDSECPLGMEKMRRAEGTNETNETQLDYQAIKKLPSVAAEFVANAIELLDLIQLESIATVERLLPYLDALFSNMKQMSFYQDDYWVIKDINQWIKWLDNQRVGKLLEGEELHKMELQVSRWLAEVRRDLKNL